MERHLGLHVQALHVTFIVRPLADHATVLEVAPREGNEGQEGHHGPSAAAATVETSAAHAGPSTREAK